MNYAKDQIKDPGHVSVNTLIQSKKQTSDCLPPYTQFEKEREKKGGTSETEVKGQASGKENSVVQKVKDGPIPARGKIVNTIGFFRQKLDDFNYANQFVANLLPQKLSNGILETIKAALINFAIGMVAAGLLLGITSGLGALIGALVGFLAGGVGAVPGAALGAKIGFEIGLFLLKWIGLGILIVHGASLLGSIGIAFGKYVINVWEASGEHKKLEKSADLCAEAIKEFLFGVLELVVMLVAAMGLARAMGALANTKFGKAIGYDQLTEWAGRRHQQSR